MLLTRSHLARMFLTAAELWQANAGRLSEIDSRFGDGDHGVTIGKIAALLSAQVAAWGEMSVKDFILELGQGILGISGGSAGPLYGTMIEGLAGPLEDQAELDGPLLKQMLASSLEEMRSITKAGVGDKTMMDALIPAVEAALRAGDEPLDIIGKAAEAAGRGAEETEKMVSRFGRARSYGEQTLGCMDAGALSTALFFQGLSRGLQPAP